jgi:hypothetical protein
MWGELLWVERLVIIEKVGTKGKAEQDLRAEEVPG